MGLRWESASEAKGEIGISSLTTSSPCGLLVSFPEMPKIRVRLAGEVLNSCILSFWSSPMNLSPLPQFLHPGRRQAEGWKGFEVRDERDKGMIMHN